MTEVVTLKALSARFTLIAKNGKKLNEYIQETGLLVLAHVQAHGDATPALKLVQALPVSFRRAKMINWFSEHSPIRLNVKEGKCGLRKPDVPDYRPFNLDTARANPWYEDKPGEEEKLPDTLTLEKIRVMITGLGEVLNKKMKAGLIPENIQPQAKVAVAMLRKLGYADFDTIVANMNTDQASDKPKGEAGVAQNEVDRLAA